MRRRNLRINSGTEQHHNKVKTIDMLIPPTLFPRNINDSALSVPYHPKYSFCGGCPCRNSNGNVVRHCFDTESGTCILLLRSILQAGAPHEPTSISAPSLLADHLWRGSLPKTRINGPAQALSHLPSLWMLHWSRLLWCGVESRKCQESFPILLHKA